MQVLDPVPEARRRREIGRAVLAVWWAHRDDTGEGGFCRECGTPSPCRTRDLCEAALEESSDL